MSVSVCVAAKVVQNNNGDNDNNENETIGQRKPAGAQQRRVHVGHRPARHVADQRPAPRGRLHHEVVDAVQVRKQAAQHHALGPLGVDLDQRDALGAVKGTQRVLHRCEPHHLRARRPLGADPGRARGSQVGGRCVMRASTFRRGKRRTAWLQ